MCYQTDGRAKMSELSCTKKWLETFVIDLNLCPFAERVKEKIRYTLSQATTEEGLLIDLQSELQILESDVTIETV